MFLIIDTVGLLYMLIIQLLGCYRISMPVSYLFINPIKGEKDTFVNYGAFKGDSFTVSSKRKWFKLLVVTVVSAYLLTFFSFTYLFSCFSFSFKLVLGWAKKNEIR